MQRDEIRFAQKPVEIDELSMQFPFDVGRHADLVVVEHAHLKTVRASRHAAADAPEANDAERLPPDVAAQKLIETHPGQVPEHVQASPSTRRRAIPMSSVQAKSAVVSSSTPGVFVATTLWRVHAGTSI